MPSEDRRAPPPVTRAGRKAAASEKRPRGRPRKDGVGGHAAPPPPPPPPPKSRKKGRSRGQAQVEDEKGAATTEKTPPLDKMKENVTSGRRGSASRRRFNTDPAPAVPEAPPSDDPVPFTLPLTSNSEEELPQTAPVAPPPSPHSLAPSPSAAPIEAEVGGASGGYSPARWPRPRLDDDDTPSPLLCRSPSEDSGSPTPSLGHTERRLQQCAFCYHGDQPPMGQGPLVVFGPTPGYIPLHILSRRTSSDRDGDCHDHCYRRSQAAHISSSSSSSSPAQCDDESSFQLVEQLGAIGLPHDIDVQTLFDPTGQCCAHLQCAAWSEGVCRGEGQSLLYVDKAIDSGSTQVCVFCGGLGASLRCRESGCGRSYHFPCAAAAGAHQDWEHRRTLCTRHAQAASRSCVSCSCGGDAGSLLMCCSCGNQYHARCLAPPLTPSSLIRASWQCLQCRVCQSCRLREETSVLLVCARCDKAYHPHCLTPPLDHTPDSKWTCQSCRVCLRCGVRSSGPWANHPFLCASCDPALPCALCGRAPDLYSLQDYVMCVCCYRCVHTQCVSIEAGISTTKCDDKSYICPTCQPQRAELAILAPISHSPAQDLQLRPTQAPHVQSPPEVFPLSTTPHSPFQLCSEQAKTPTEPTGLSHEGPVPFPADATELQQSPTLSSSSATEHRLTLVLAASNPEELQQSPTPSPSNSGEQRLSLVLSPSDPTELQQSPKSLMPTELKPSPRSSPSPATEPQQRLSPEPSPCYPEPRLNLILSLSDPPELQQSPESSPSNPAKVRLSPTQSSSNPTDPQQNTEPSPIHSTVLRDSPLPSPANLTASPCSSSSLDHTELHQSPSELQTSLATSPFNPTQFSESPPQYPSEHTDLPLTSHPTELQLSTVRSSSNNTEIQRSLVPSLSDATDHQQSPVPSPSNITELQQSPDSSSFNVTELHPTPVPSSLMPTEFQLSFVPSPSNAKDVHMSPVQSPSNDIELQQSPLPFPNVTEFQQSPPFPSNVTELHPTPVPSSSKPTEFQRSSVPSPSNAKDVHMSPVQSPSNDTELQQSPLPCPNVTEFQQSPPFPSNVTELNLNPIPSSSKPTEFQRSSVPSPSNAKDVHMSPVQSPSNDTELQQNPLPCPNVTEFQQSPPFPSNVTELNLNQIPSLSKPTEFQQSPVLSPSNAKDLRLSPVPSPSNPKDRCLSPVPSHSDAKDLHLSPVPSPSNAKDLCLSPVLSPSKLKDLRLSPVQSPFNDTEIQQSTLPTPNVTDFQQSPTPSPSVSDLHLIPVSFTSKPTEFPQSPVLSPSNTKERHQSPVQSPNITELHQSPVQSPNNTELHQSPVQSPNNTELPQSPVQSPNITALHQCPVPSTNISELQQCPLSSPSNTTDLHLSLDQSSNVTQLQKSPVLSIFNFTDLPPCPTPPPSKITELQQSPVPSSSKPTVFQESLVPSPINVTELHQSPVSSPSNTTELQQSSTPSLSNITEILLSPTPSPSYITELQQSPKLSSSVTELHRSPIQSPLNITELHQSIIPSPSNITEHCVSPVPFPSGTEFHQTPVQSPNMTALQQSPTSSTSNVTELLQSPVPSPSEVTNTRLSPEPSTPIPTNVQPSLVQSPSVPAELHESPVPLPSNATEQTRNSNLLGLEPLMVGKSPGEHQHLTTPSYPCGADLQKGALQPPPSPADLVKTHLFCFETAELQECPAAPHLSPVQVKNDPHVNHVPWECKENHATSPIIHFCSTPPPLFSVPLDMEPFTVLLTSTPAQLSPPSSPSMQSTREKLATEVSPKSPVQDSTMSELRPSRFDGDEAKPEIISPDHIVQDDGTQLSRAHSPADVTIDPALLRTHQGKCIPELHCSTQVVTSPLQSPTQDVEMVLAQESNSSHLATFTLDQDLSPGSKHLAYRPSSAPCSPSRVPLNSTPCSLSQPASPARMPSTQPARPLQLRILSRQFVAQLNVTTMLPHGCGAGGTELRPGDITQNLNLDSQTLESALCCSATVVPAPPSVSHLQSKQSSPLRDPPLPTPSSLVHQSTSVDRSSLVHMSSDAETVEDVPYHQSASLDCTLQCTKPLEHQASTVHIQASMSGASPSHASEMPASPASSLQASCDSMTEVTDPAEPLPARTSPLSQQDSPVMLTGDCSSQPPASPSSVLSTHADTIPPKNENTKTAVDHLCQVTGLQTGPGPLGGCSPTGCVRDPEPPQLTESGQSSLLQVSTCSSPSETKLLHSTNVSPTHCRPAYDSSDSQGLSIISLEESVCLSNQSSLQTCVTLRTCTHASSSRTPTQAAETFHGSPTGSTDSSLKSNTQATFRDQKSLISTSLQLDSGPCLTSDSSWKTKPKSTSCQPGSLTARQASVTYPRQSPAPLSPLNDRLPSSPTQEHTDMPEPRCTHKTLDRSSPTRATQTHTVNGSQLYSHSQLANAQITQSLTPTSPEEPETSTGPAVHTLVESETGPCPTGPTSIVLSVGEATSIYTTDQEEHLSLHQYLPETTKGGVLDLEKNEQEQEGNEEQKQENSEQEESEVQNQEEQNQGHKEQNQEELSSSKCPPSGVHLSPGEPAAVSPFLYSPPSPSSPSPTASPPPSTADLQHGDVSSEASLPLSVAPDAPSSLEEQSEWGQEDMLLSQKMLEATKDVVQSHAGSSEKESSTPDAVAMRPNQEEVRESSSDGEGEPEPFLDMEVMKPMSSSSPLCESPRLPSSPSPPPLTTRSLRPPPHSSPPSDELSIRLRRSPFSTEASPETSPVRVPLTPPPLSPPSPPLSFTPPYTESPPLCKTPPSTVIPLTRKIGMGKPAISKRKFSPGRARVRQGSWWSNVRAVSPPSSSQDSMGEGGRDSPKFRQADPPFWSMRVGRGLGFPGRRRSRGGGVGGGRGGRGRSRIKTQDCLSVSPACGVVESVPPKQEEENSMHNTVVMFSTSDVFTLRQDMCVVCGSFGQGAEGRLLSCSQCGQCYHPYCVNVKVTRVILTKGWRCLECTVCEACGEATDPGRLLLCDDCDISYHTYCLDPPLHTVPKGAWKCKWCVWCVQCGSASPGLCCDWQSNYSRCGPCASLTCCPLCQRAYTNDDLILQCQQCDRWVHAVCEGLTTEHEVEITADEGFDCSLCRTHSHIPYGRLDNLDMAQILSRSREADTKTYSQDGVCLTESGLSQLQSLVEPLTSARRYRRCKPKLKLRIINQNSVSVLQTPPHPDTGHLECDLKSDSSPEREHVPEDDVSKDLAKRKRKPYRPGIGGFMVRQRGGKAGAGAVKVCGGKDSSEMLQADEDGAEQSVDKVKKRYRKKKTKLEEAFPSYLQEAFFGRDLLYRIRQVDQGAVDGKGPTPSEKLMDRKQERLPLSDDALVDLRDVLDTHPHILATGHAAGPLPTSELTGSGGQAQRALHEEPLDAILNPELDKMVTDGAILSKLYKIPELEGKDVEELFTAVLSPDASEQHNQHAHAAAAGVGAFPRLALLNGVAGRAPDVDVMPGGAFCGATPCLLPTNQAAGEGEHDAMSTAQRSMLKWEKEEALGEQATVAPVLYCNTNFPHLREQYPEWSTRVKQIAKLWRKASSQDRAPYVQHARDNRAAQRISKVHMSSEPPKRAQPSQPPPLQGPYDAVSPDADLALKDPLRPRESQQEQEWKLRQGEVKDRWRAGKKRQENTDKDCPFQASLAGGGKEAPQMRQKSKQQAKMEATQKLEQVKNEQQRQQLSANQQPDVSPDVQARQNLLQGSSLADNVFLRPQVPPPSGYSSLPHSPRSPHSSSPLQQPPSSPQVFSPPSSRPTSPWDPYSKPAGTPRPASVQRCPLLSVSPALGSPAPSPDSKASDASRTLAPQPGLQHSRAAMKSPPSGSQVYHRSQVQGGVFKAPMPPQNQLQQELFGTRRDPSRPADLSLPQPQDPAFHSGLGSPQRSPYAPTLGTPRVDNSQQMAEPIVQQSSLPSQPSHDAYTNSPTSGPHSDSLYLPNTNPSLSTSPALCLDHLKMVTGRRPSPSHPALDPYSSNTGAPRPSVPERFPRSPGGTLTSDPYARAPGTPRPSPDPYVHQPPTPHPQKAPETFGQAQVETFAPQLGRSSIGRDLGGGTVTHKQSPQQDSFPRTPASSQTPKHLGASDDRFSSGHVTCGPSQMDKMAANDMVAVGVTSLEGPLCLLPQLGDSEEKLKQRQRLRQLILRQQQQKSALRQDKGLQEAGPSVVTPGPAAGAATPHRWLQDATATSPTDVFGRPPPPYPGTLRLPRPAGVYPGAFPGEQPRGLTPSASGFPVQSATPLRFGLQDSFPRPPLALVPGAGLAGPRVAPVPMRKPVQGELIAIRHLTATSPHPHIVSVAPQAFPVPPALSVQQHSIMGQPYIELRHRAAENRLRLPFSLTVGPVSETPPPAAKPSLGARTGETATGRPMLLMLPLNQQNQQNLVQAPALGPGNDAALQGAEGMDEHLEGVDSAVKDLEDVEVKDLVDLNLNLDPEDGKEDLDLGANDLHLDDFLLSGKFDLIAYADPELNLDDKKDMFNEELDLGESTGDKKDGPRKTDNVLGQVKKGGDESVKADPQDQSAPLHLPPQPRKLPGPDGVFGLPVASGAEAAGASQPGSSLHLAKGELGVSGILPELHAQGKVLSSAATPTPAPGPQSDFQRRAPGPSSAYLDPPPQTHPLPFQRTSAHQGLPSGSGPHSVSLRLPQPCLLLNTQAQPPQRDVPTQTQDQDQNKGKPLLLEEQPLLLQDLLDQERQEQQQQKQMQALIRQKSTSEPGIPDLADFDSISDPIMKAKMVALKGINKVMSQGNLGLNNMVVNRFHQAPGAATPEATTQPPLSVGQDAELTPQPVQPSPPSCGPGFVNDSQRRQYEEWLGETQQLLQMQQCLLEDQIAVHRKTKKALSAKQRTAKKAGRVLGEEDAAQLRYVVDQQSAVQKQLEQIRKQQKDHTVLIEDYKTKQRQQRAPTNVPAAVLPQNVLPLQKNAQSVPHGWSPAGSASRPPPQMSPARSTTPQVSAVVPGLPTPTAGFAPSLRGPAGGTSAGDSSTPSPQVKFDDNNPFSEGFQERERRERLREQQERHRVQLMQGVERHRVLHQQRLDLDQQGLGSRSGAAGPAVGETPGSTPCGEGLSQMPFFSSELPQDFLQSPPGPGPPTLGGQAGGLFPQTQQGFTVGPLPHGVGPASEFIPGASPERGRVLPVEAASPNLQTKPRAAGSLGQVHAPGALQMPSKQGGQGLPFSPDSASSSPSAVLHASFSSSPLPQLYADILPDDGPKRRRSVNRDRDNAAAGGGARTPLSTHSDDITAPPTPAFSDTSCSTPTRSGAELADLNLPLSALAPSSELERQLSVVCAAQERSSLLGTDAQSDDLCGSRTAVKEEREERGACGGNPVKLECASPLYGGRGGDLGKELLRHLLKEKNSPAKTPSPSRQLSGESARSKDEDGAGFHGNMTADGPDVLDLLGKRKPQRCKRAARPDKDKTLCKYKRRRREDDDDDDDHHRALDCSSSPSEQIMTHLTQLSALPLMEPVLGLDLSPFPPYGGSSLGRDSRLSGSFGSACLDGVADYYTQLTCKNLLGNPPTPPASLPPTPPPVAKQKLVNGFATAEEVSRKDVRGVTSKGEDLHQTAKTVDVPASLPTPPHNNQEELRVQDSSSPCDSPDGFVPSSSPESVADTEVSRYPDLSFVKTEAPSPCPSPPIPIVPCSWGKGTALKREVKMEPNHQAPPSCSKADLVTIAITLNPTASQNVPGVVAAVAKLLRVPASVDYRLSHAQCAPLGLMAGVSVPLPQTSASSRQPRTAPPAGVRMDPIQRSGGPAVSRPPSCSFCKVLLGNGVRQIKEAKQEGSSSLLFCSPNCSALYSSGLKSSTSADEPPDDPPPPLPQHRYTNNMSSITVHSLPPAAVRAAGSSPPLHFPSASAVTMETKPRVDSLKVKVKLKPHPYAFSEGDDSLPGKRTKSSRWRRWNVDVALSRGPISDKAVATPTEEEGDVLLKKLGACLRPDPFPTDRRRCCFCHQQGDGETDGPARLLNLDLDLWVHLNCALWSSEVYETQAGALINVELALRRGLSLRCAHCQRTGATSGCNRLRCANTYHFTCALRAHCTFFKDKTMLCQLHRPRTGSSAPGPTPDPRSWARDPYNSELRRFAVFRRVYVQRDEARQVAAMVQRGEARHTFRVGSLLFCAVGRLLPRQMNAFHDAAAIFPVGYHADRIYWSMRQSNRRCKYMCFIEEHDARPLFKVKVVEKGYDDLVLTAPTPKGVWEQILEPVARLRSSSGTLKLFPDFLKGEDLFGLSASAVSRIVESLPGVEACERYTFRYGRNPLMEWPLAFNPSGSARSEPKASAAKRPYLPAGTAPRCQGSVGSIVGPVPGVISLSPGETVAGAHQGRHSKLAQYRRMKADWKTNVYLARSRIQGLGLYAARDIEKCTMVIEYIGAIIRSEVANRKERLYESQNRGVYMFRIDNDYVIDATIAGGPARYINHSCAPNCITEVVSVDKENKIIISSCRRIQRGEELSYDYKFDLEDDQHKIPCHCGAFNCRKWMN
ncbi:histone-lysine N-methyltransferase 2C-like isoform X3 [Phyllopteryx taeniolatus]|uniref:histone-lysine N-methyltransferase 2C-like isoform X3 n=1 Tax=Phyllopteryx taeniolatus TaxID=161469 RepID=UPI002AD5B456|nr:histone-lysine N-methyltransferase 2C-like isoform X3 [Phyllopteryx taeniolatus]